MEFDSVTEAIIVNLIVGLGLMQIRHFVDNKSKSYVLKKPLKFNLEEKTMLAINIGSVALAASMIVIGAGLAQGFIQAQSLPDIPEDAHETQRFYNFLVLSFSIGILFMGVGVVWIKSSLGVVWTLYSSSRSHKTKSKGDDRKATNKEVFQTKIEELIEREIERCLSKYEIDKSVKDKSETKK